MALKHSIKSLREARDQGQPITWLTCYEYSFATALNSTDLDMILVGDSGGMVALGYGDTVPVTMDEMILLASAVRRGAPDKFIVGDMPKGSYEASDLDAVHNAMRFVKQAGSDAVKLEGGLNMVSRVKAISEAGIPVIGHIGLTPQSSAAFGGYRVVGRNSGELDELRNSMLALEGAGAFSILLEATPPRATKELTSVAKSIILGIGAGKNTHGQLLILHDLLGLYPSFRPKFAKCYVPEVVGAFSNSLENLSDIVEYGKTTRKDGLHELTRVAVEAYVREVKTGNFPNETFSYKD
jgi:3-methyl-2-oxobutanoate hydroxymethyltransferase